MRRVAAVDCGTNSIRLLIADLDTERMVATDLSRQMRIVRLGEGVDRTGRLSAAAIDRTIAALREYADLIRGHAPEAVRMVATSATRDAANSAEFTRRVKEVLGVEPEVVSGDEEAHLSFTGATRELAGLDGGPYLVT
ncbi:MAG: exopolyphosphatase, partial [Nocardiopsaceae bacterium]|nr:exopolyphosphatase [Nocardiopsaceae bacterium]